MKVTDDQIINVALSALSMRAAAEQLGMHISSFIPRAKKLGVYKTNQGRIGITRSKDERIKRDRSITLNEILNGEHPQYQTSLLRRRLIEEGIKERKCEMEGCQTCDPNVLYSLDHIDGNSRNHMLSNLRILCPNCHSKTTTFAGKNKLTKKVDQFKTDKELILAIRKHNNIRLALIEVGLNPKGANYKRAERLQELIHFIENMIMSS